MLSPREQREFMASLDPEERAAITREYRNRIIGPLVVTILLLGALVGMAVVERRVYVAIFWALAPAVASLAWAVRGWWRYR